MTAVSGSFWRFEGRGPSSAALACKKATDGKLPQCLKTNIKSEIKKSPYFFLMPHV